MAFDWSKLNYSQLLALAQQQDPQLFNAGPLSRDAGYGPTNLPSAGIDLSSLGLPSNAGVTASPSGGMVFNMADPNGSAHRVALTNGANGGVNMNYYNQGDSLLDKMIPLGVALGSGLVGANALGLLGAGGAGGSLGTIGSGANSIGTLSASDLGVGSMPTLGAGDIAASVPGLSPGALTMGAAGGLGGTSAADAAGSFMAGTGPIGSGASSIGSIGAGGTLPTLGASDIGSAGGAALTGGGGGMSGLLSDAQSALSSPWGKLGTSLLGGLLGGTGAHQAGTTTNTIQNQIDPRLGGLLYGTNGQPGLLNNIVSQAGAGPSPGLGAAFQQGSNYAMGSGSQDLNAMSNTAHTLMGGGYSAPTASAPQGGMPSQQGMDLTGSYNSLINGTPGANPFLTGAIQKGIDQAGMGMQNWQTNATRNLIENILPTIQSGAQANGMYGSDREGIAQGNAIRDFSTQQQQTLQNMGLNAQDTAAAQQAAAYNADRDRQLAATQGLSGQQYGADLQQKQLDMQAALANQQSQLATNQLNSGNMLAGAGLLGNTLGNATNLAAQGSNYGYNKLLQAGGLLGGYTGAGGTQLNSTPYFTNPGANFLGGALSAYNLYNNLTGG